MAFQNALEGDCGGQNALMKLGSHFSQDQAFRQDRNLPPHFANGDAMVNDFLEERFSQNLQTFSMNSLAQELREMDRFARQPLSQAPNVAQLAPRETSSLWSEEFLRAEKHGSALHRHDEALQDFQPSALQGAVADDSIFDAEPSFERAVTNPTTKGTSVLDLEWNEQFEQRVPESMSLTGGAWVNNYLSNRRDELGLIDLPSAGVPIESESKFQKFWQRSDEGENEEKTRSEPVLEGYGQEELEQAWNSQSELEQMWGGDDNKEFWQSMQKMWQQLSNAGENAADEWTDEFGTFVDPYKTYSFEEQNPMKELENPMEEGLRKLEAQDIPSAVLCFEAAVQAEPENALAWQYLGTTQAKNEQDPLAIAALKKCLSLDGDNLTALLGLAISYTNESYQNSACEMLREWLARNPKYRTIPPPPSKQFVGSSLLDSDFHRAVQEYFIAAANKNPVGEIDAGVQGALGVLFNLSYDYDKAIDCFKAALQVNPTDYETWNRLGATLANGNRSEEAVDAYYNALHLSPGFIRARYNLGITCINLGATREAAEHLLSALNQQAKGSSSRGERGTMSEGIWSTLRLVVSQMGDPALLPAVEQRDLATLNTAFKIK